MSAAPPASFKVASGTLLKQSSSGLFWNQRYFVLTPRELVYYDAGALSFTAPASSRQQQPPKGTAELDGASVSNTKSTRAGKFAFRLTTRRRQKWVLSGSTLAETLEWLAALESGSRPPSRALNLVPEFASIGDVTVSRASAWLNLMITCWKVIGHMGERHHWPLAFARV